MKHTAILLTTLGLLLGSLHAQTVPALISYQGRVTDSSGVGLGTGTPVNRKVIFRIYDAATGGTRLWTEEQTTTLANGEFSILLGNGIAPTGTAAGESRPALDTVFTSGTTDRYIEITVDNGDNTINASDLPIAPRQRITSTAFTLRARSAESIATGTDLQLNGSADYGLGWYGTGRLFNGISVNGPVLYGQAGGALGSAVGTNKQIALSWDGSRNVIVGAALTAGGAINGASLNVGAGSINGGNITGTGTVSGASLSTAGIVTAGGATMGAGGFAAPGANTVLQVTGAISGGSLNVANAIAGGSLTTTGNVGIGTAVPNERLHVVGNAVTTGSLSVGTSTIAGSASLDIFKRATTAPIFANLALGDDSSFTTASDTAVNGMMLFRGFGWMNGLIAYYPHLLNDTAAFRITGQNATFGDRETSLWVDGRISSGVSSPVAPFRMQVKSNAGTVWEGAAGFGGTSAAVVVGQLNSVATIGGHAPGLNGWANLVINADGGNVGIGTGTTTAPAAKLEVAGSIRAATINTTGNVGIGTTATPTAALDVKGWVNTTLFRWGYLANSGFNDADISAAWTLSIRAEGAVSGSTFVVESDERIKNVLGVSDGGLDLARLLQIQVTDYTMKDQVGKGRQPFKKVIAQQVEKVYPQAVRRTTDVVPDIYQKASIKAGWVSLKTDLKKGDRVRLIAENAQGVHEVLEVAEGRFRTAFEPEGKDIFVYGREVKDFRVVDYEAISMLNVSATQQLKKEKDAEVKALQTENAELRARLAKLEAKDKARDAKLAAIEALLSGEKPAVQTVSLQKNQGAE